MTEHVDLGEFVTGFIAESEELVAAAHAALIDIEAANAAGTVRPRAVRELFRALHTIKGLAGMIGVEPIVELAHALEGLVRIADRSGGALERKAVDVSLRGVAMIAERVRAVAAQHAPSAIPSELLDAIAAATEQRSTDPRAAGSEVTAALPAPGSAAPAWYGELAPADVQQLSESWRAGLRAWRVTFVPSDANAARGMTIGTVRAGLAKLGEILKVLPRATPGQGSGIAFDLLVASNAAPGALAAAAATSVEQLVELSAPPDATRDESAPPDATRDESAPPDARWGESPGSAGREGTGTSPTYDGSVIGRSLVRVELTRLDALQEQLSLLLVSRFRLEREIAALAERGSDVRTLREIATLQSRQLRDLRRAILRARMVRVAEVLEPLALLVRSLGRTAQKSVRLALDARDAEVDKAVADRLLPALVHLVRNAVDHAIEPADERAARGKPREGTVTVRCTDTGNSRLELVVEDDGRGIDRGAIAARAARSVDSDGELLDVLTSPGFSTRDVASRTSGRGLGMDIVRRIATGDLGGELAVATTPGAGTAFTLRVPLTIAVVDVFTFACGPQTFVAPVSSIDEIFELALGQDLQPPAPSDPRAPVRLAERRGEAIPLRSLGSLLAIDDGVSARKALIVRRGGTVIGFTVDRMLGRQEVVVRPIDDPLVKVPGITGSTDLGDGRPTLVLDLHALGAQGVEVHA